jgi:PAS domain S-box-containing protein
MKYSDNFNEFSRYVHEKLNNYMGAEICQLTLYDRSKGILNTICVRDEAIDISNSQNPFANGLQEYTIATAQALLLNSSEFDEFTQRTGYEVSIHNQKITPKVLLLVPLLRSTGVEGVITIASTRNEKDLVHDDIELMEFVATQISTVLERQEAHHEVQKAQRTIEHSMNAVLTTDLEGNVVYANPAAGDMWGYPDASTMIAHKPHLFNYYPLDTHPMLHKVMRLTKAEGRYFNNDGLNCLRKDGTSLIAQIGASSVKNEAGETIGLTFSCIDITELKRTENDYDRLLDTMNEGVIEVDNDEKILYVNKKFCSLAGYTREELLHQNANELFTVDSDKSKEMKRKVTQRKKGARETYETQLKKKNGETIWVYTNAAPVVDEHGTVIGSVGIMADITQRKKDEEKLESLSRFPRENPAPVFRYSIDTGQVVYSNPAGKLITNFLKLKENKAIYQHWEMMIKDAYKNNTVLVDEFQVKELIYMATFAPIVSGKYVNIYANDITERKKMEDKMTWQVMKLEKYAFVTSHQLRRPIATILGLVNIFDYENLDSEFNIEVLEKFKIAAQEMDAVTRETVELLVEDEFLDEE